MRIVLATLLCGGALVAALGCSVYASTWSKKTVDVPVSATGWTDLSVENRNGAVVVHGSRDGTVSVTAVIKGGGSDEAAAQAAVDAIQIDAVVEGTTQKLSWSWKKEKRGWDGSVSFEVTLPVERTVNVLSRNGSLTVTDREAPVVLETRNGAVTVEDVTGAVKVTTRNGDLKLSSLSGGLLAHTRNGAIDADQIGGMVDFESRNGSVRAVLTSRQVEGRVVTRNGSVQLDLPDDAATRIDAKSDNGRVRVAHASFVQKAEAEAEPIKAEKHRFIGDLGGGGSTLTIETRNGSVTVE